MRVRAAVLAVLWAGCGGDDEGEGACDELLIEVTVNDGMGGAVPGVEVSIGGGTPCADTGDGMLFECVAPDTGDINVYAEATDWEAKGQQVTVTEPDDCASPAATVELSLIRESAV